MAKQGEIVVGLDIGTTKVCAVVAEVKGVPGDALAEIEILGVGNVPCKGLRKGVVANVASTTESIRQAIEEAQNMAGVEIRTVFAGIAGSHVRAQTSNGVVAISSNEVTRSDVDRVLENARAIPIPTDRQILHVLPCEYLVDTQDGIREPVGMSGVRLEVKAQLITAARSCVENVIKCAERCGLTVADVVLEPLASAEAVLTEDEREIGVAVVDIGGGTTDVILYVDGGIVSACVIPVGGMSITSDIAAGLRTPMAEAERLKHSRGCALARMVADDEEMEVPGVGGYQARRVPRRVLADIIEPRVEEIFAVVRKQLEDSGYVDQLSAGVVLCGGATLMEGMVELGEEILGMPVRRGIPVGTGGLTDLTHGPQFATAVGLTRYGAQTILNAAAREEEAAQTRASGVRDSREVRQSGTHEAAEVPQKRGLLAWIKEAF
jgi:cell division protein FtsA